MRPQKERLKGHIKRKTRKWDIKPETLKGHMDNNTLKSRP